MPPALNETTGVPHAIASNAVSGELSSNDGALGLKWPRDSMKRLIAFDRLAAHQVMESAQHTGADETLMHSSRGSPRTPFNRRTKLIDNHETN